MYTTGDVTHDNNVNVGDLQMLAVAWASNDTATSNWNPAADLNNNGYVNVGDLQLLVGNWNRHVLP